MGLHNLSASTTIARAAATLLAAPLLVGCGGGPSELDKSLADVVVSAAELRLANEMVAETRDGTGDLQAATEGLIRVLREHRRDLGDDQIELKLTDAANTVAGWCPECERMLDRELERLE